MKFTVYKTTNVVNGKIYIGKHQTENPEDDYLGSGKMLRYAIEKYGIENFKKEILFVFDNERDMNLKEAELVTEEFTKLDSNYNMCPGGQGGWGYYRSNFQNGMIGKTQTEKQKKAASLVGKKHQRTRAKAGYAKGLKDYWNGKNHSDETKTKMSLAAKERTGSKNSQFGSMWITNGIESIKVKKDFTIPEGWYKGRKVKKLVP